MAHNPWPFRAVTRTAALPEAPFRPQRRGVPEAHGGAPPIAVARKGAAVRLHGRHREV